MLFLQGLLKSATGTGINRGRFINTVNPCSLLPELSFVHRGRSGSPGMRKGEAQFLAEVSSWKLTLYLAEEECPLGQLCFPSVMNKAEMH